MKKDNDDKDEKSASLVYAAIQQPDPLQQDGNMATNWREFKSAFDYFLIASGKDSVSPKEKCALFMHVIGKYGREIIEELDISEADKHNYVSLCKKYSEHCDPKKNINYERHKFFEIYQKDQSFDKFLSSLKIQSKHCEFEGLKNSLILTQLIRGVQDVHMKEKLLAKSSLTLEEAIQWGRAAERAGQQASAYAAARVGGSAAGSGDVTVEQLRRGAGGSAARGRQPWRPAGASGASHGQQYRPRRADACGKCGYRHSASERCAAYNVKCYRCDKIGHFAKCCKAKFTRELLETPGGESGEDCTDENGELLLYDICIDAQDSSRESWTEIISVNGINIRFKLDSGADASVMSLKSFQSAGFKVNKLKQCNTVLREISKKQLPVVGYFEANLQFRNKTINQKIFVLNVNCNNLLGLKACVNLNLIQRNDSLSIFNLDMDPSVFEGIGCLPTECKIQIDKSVAPVVSATRRIPMKLRPRLKNELDNMEKLGIIIKEHEPTDWVSSIVVVEKPNKSLRLCLDPRNLNRAVKRSHFPLPTIDDISSNLVGAKYFSKCDAKNGFWMQKLDLDSSKLCTFATPYGRYRFLRLPFGINCAPELFHREMTNIFKMEGVEVYIDDVLIWGSTKEEHDERLKEVMRRAKENGVKFNKDKCLFGVKEITFLGHIFSECGMRPDKNRVKAITDMSTPSDKKELERFLGVTNYLCRFIPRYSEVSAPLRELLGKDVEFTWLHNHDQAFKTLKNKISNAPVLKYYSPEEPVTVSVDASSHGLGACLLQDGRPVAYAARTLTPTERRWAQIEKELLAVVFGCTRFHQYIYGHDKVTVESDHKPLETIIKKQLNETPARLQRLMIKLQHYCIDLQYKPGKLLFIADTLSRATTASGNDDDLCEDVMIHINTLYENIEATPEMLKKIKEETEKDTILTTVCQYYKNGWLNNKNQVAGIVKAYWSVHNELHVVNGILFRNDRVVIPAALRKEMLRRIHEGHMGIEKCQRRAREVMWWPGMSTDIQSVVESCESCQRHRAANPRQPLQPHPLPDRPWQVLAADIFEIKEKRFLLVVDYYSKYVEIAQLQNLQSATTIKALKDIFSRFGIPQKIVTDNGTQFSSEEFKLFCKSWEFVHETSSPLYPRSNGLAERNVRTVKLLMVKAEETGEDWQIALLNFRNTPVTAEQYSPAQLLMSRQLNTRLPVYVKNLQPKTANKQTVIVDREKRIHKYKESYDKGTRNLGSLNPNDTVKMRNKNVWINSKIINRARGNRSYWVETENGGVFRRNRQHLLKIPKGTSTKGIDNEVPVAAPPVHRPTYHPSNIDWEHVSSSVSNQRQELQRDAGSNPAETQNVIKLRSGRIVRRE